MGKITTKEKRIVFIFLLVVFFWIFKHNQILQYILPFVKKLTDTSIIMIGAISLFLFTENKKSYLKWSEVQNKVPWGILLLIGGGISLATLLKQTNVVFWLSSYLEIFGSLPVIFILILISLIVTFLTEINSNTATSIILIPIAWSLAVKTGLDPLMLTSIVAFSASSAFMLPTATPPNAVVVCKDEYLNINDMMRAGLILNFIIPPIIAIIIWRLW